MAGHSKWANIKRRKGAVDAKRGKIFTKLAREIMTAAKLGGPDPDANPRLRLAIVAAKAQSMPNANIDRAIARGSGGGEGTDVEEISYEGYGPGGVAMLVEAQTDNRNRTASEVKAAFSKNGGNLGQPGSVAWIFNKVGVFVFDSSKTTEEKVMEAALEGGAEDIKSDEDSITVTCEPTEFLSVNTQFEEAGLQPESAELTMIPENEIEVAGEQAEQVLRLVDKLEDLDDVQKVYANFDISDEELARLEA